MGNISFGMHFNIDYRIKNIVDTKYPMKKIVRFVNSKNEQLKIEWLHRSNKWSKLKTHITGKNRALKSVNVCIKFEIDQIICSS